jgi:hypothetical protein
MYAGPRYEVTPYVGKKIYNYSNDKPRFDDGEALIGLKGNVYIKPQVSVQLAAEASKENAMLKTGEPNAWTDLERGMLNVQYDVPTGKRVTPYILGGMGYERLHKSEASTNVDSQAFYNAGAGLRYNVNKRVDLVAETRVIHKVEDQDTDIIGTVGVGMKFGNERKALSLADLKKRTPKVVEPAVAASLAPAVEPAPVVAPVVEPAAEVIDTRIEYDSGVVDVCQESISVDDSCPSGRDISTDLEGYYVQVIALRKNSPDVIASRLDAKGYTYTFKEEADLTRVLVGPYESRSAAASALRGLKKIRRDAFIYHAK